MAVVLIVAAVIVDPHRDMVVDARRSGLAGATAPGLRTGLASELLPERAPHELHDRTLGLTTPGQPRA